MKLRRLRPTTALSLTASITTCRLRWVVILACPIWVLAAAASEPAFENGRAGREPASDLQGSPGFVWGATETIVNSDPSLNARVDGFDPWHPLSNFKHGSPDDPLRHLGLGDPLIGTSWRNRPLHVGWLFGGLIGDDLTRDQAEQHEDLVGGYRLGWDFDHYWGTEARFAFSNVDFTDAGDSENLGTAQNRYWDLNLLYYPWGDSRWRPFASLGMGWGSFAYTRAAGDEVDKTLFTIPIAGGVKYYFKHWMALRLTATDNWAIGQGPLNTMHNVSLTADVELHFGGRRTNYFPYSGSIHMW